MNSGRGMMGGASPNDCILIGERLAQVQSSVESLQRTALTRNKYLKEGLNKVISIPYTCYCTYIRDMYM